MFVSAKASQAKVRVVPPPTETLRDNYNPIITVCTSGGTIKRAVVIPECH